jgi:hypothetical protein
MYWKFSATKWNSFLVYGKPQTWKQSCSNRNIKGNVSMKYGRNSNGRGNRSTGRKPCLNVAFQLQFSYGLRWEWTRASAGRSCLLTAWFMAQFFYLHVYPNDIWKLSFQLKTSLLLRNIKTNR